MRAVSGVWRALEQARAMNLAAEGRPVPTPGGEGISRRRALALLAGGAGALALPRWPAFAQEGPKVAIVGGGLAGLAALDILRRRGVDATLYEARGATGGRTRSVRGVFANDYTFDEGAQLVNTDHVDLIGLINRFRLVRVDRQGFGPGHEIQIGRDGRATSEARLAQALRPIAARIAADAERIDSGDAAATRALDALSVRAYLDRHRMPPGDARDALEAGIRTEYGAEPDEASALELLYNLPVVDGRHVARISTSDERYLISGGTDQVARRLAAEHGEAIRLNKRLTALDLDGRRPRLTFADGDRERADRVIIALPAPMIREVRIEGPLPPLWRALIDEVRLGRNEKLIVGYDDIAAFRRPLGFGGALWAAGDFSAVWNAVSLAPAPGQGALCYFLGGNQVDAAANVEARALAERFTAAARRVLPGLPAPNGRIRRTRWCDDPLTKGAYSNFRPGQATRFASLFAIEEEDGRVQVPRAGPLLFAGEWLSEAWPGYMNGAVQTGRIAAESILAEARAQAA